MATSRVSWPIWAIALLGILLVVANWFQQPDRAWAWLAAIVALVLALAGRRLVVESARRSPGSAPVAKSMAGVAPVLSFGTPIVTIALALALAQGRGLLTDPDLGQRLIVIMSGLYLAAIGNALPRRMPAASVVRDDPAALQRALRVAGWAWTLCGLGVAAGGLVLPAAAAGPVALALVALAILVLVVQLLRVGRPRQQAVDSG